MKNGWIKIFHGTYITGIDGEDTSWSGTRLQGLRGVIVHHNGVKIELVCGDGEYHYSEDYEYDVNTQTNTLLTRRIQFKTPNGWETHEIDVINKKANPVYMSEEKI